MLSHSSPIIRSCTRLFTLALLAGLTPSAHALTYLVGAGGAPCDYSTIQAAINGAASHAGADSIRIASDQTYGAQALTIGTQDLTIVGGYASCAAALPDAALPSGVTVINGQGGASAPVFNISGAGVRDLRNLGIQGGDVGNAAGGGGILFNGHGDLILRETVINNNHAGFGAGIAFYGDGGGPAVLTLEAGTLIAFNVAYDSGGGILINGQARLFALRDRTSIQSNLAQGLGGGQGFGGGVYVVAPAFADFGSPGYNSAAILEGNEAQRGGGLAVIGKSDSDDDVNVRMFTTDPNRPVRMHGNRANVRGGAAFLRSYECSFPSLCLGSEAQLCAFNFHMDANRAPEGAAGYGENAYIADLRLNGNCTGFPETSASLGAVNCTLSAPGCNLVDNNIAMDSNNAQTTGAIFDFQNARLEANGLSFTRNSGGNLTRSSVVELRGNQLVANSLSSDLLRIGDYAKINSCTMASNVLGGATHVIRMDSAGLFQMKNSIVWEPSKLTLLYPGNLINNSNVDMQYNILNDSTATSQGPTNRQVDDPRFNFPAVGDFRLRVSSPAIDFAPPVTGDDRDLDGRPFDQQITPGPARALVRDVGAFERQYIDPLLLNNSFGGSLIAWQILEPSYTTYSTQDAAGNSAPGSVQVVVPAPQPGDFGYSYISVMSQCFNVPWPAIYSLNAKTLTRIFNFDQYPDSAIVHWRLRANSIDCTGAITGEGDVPFSAATGWHVSQFPAEISITPQLWNFRTTLEITLDVAQNPNDPDLSGLFARFDDVLLQYSDIDKIFADDFE